MVWVNLEGLSVKRNGCLVVTLLSCSVAFSVECFCLSLKLRIELNILHIEGLRNCRGRWVSAILLISLAVCLTRCTMGRVWRLLGTKRVFLYTDSHVVVACIALSTEGALLAQPTAFFLLLDLLIKRADKLISSDRCTICILSATGISRRIKFIDRALLTFNSLAS
jgi:hypothetical protein